MAGALAHRRLGRGARYSQYSRELKTKQRGFVGGRRRATRGARRTHLDRGAAVGIVSTRNSKASDAGEGACAEGAAADVKLIRQKPPDCSVMAI